ncbi:hypothetical protein M1N59_01550 [Dehalococcoidales bacterium]|nr:hypothetical protein [Dehalococcoidales bacterium]
MPTILINPLDPHGVSRVLTTQAAERLKHPELLGIDTDDINGGLVN